MTKCVKLVSMNNSKYSDIEQMLDHFAGTEGLDPMRLRKRNRILGAATRLFIRQGYRKTSVDEVATEASVAKGTVYLYFKTKAELLLHAIIEEKRGYLAQAKPVFDGTIAPEDRLAEWLKLLFTLGVEMPLISRLMSNDREILTALEEFPPDVMKESLAMQSHFIGEMLAQAAGDSEFSEEEMSRTCKGNSRPHAFYRSVCRMSAYEED